MQLIVDIPDEKYNVIKSELYNTFPAEMKEWGLEAIRKGIPLSKITESKTGYWIEHPHEAGPNWEYSRYECSECHVWVEDDSDYCPYCGADMSGNENTITHADSQGLEFADAPTLASAT